MKPADGDTYCNYRELGNDPGATEVWFREGPAADRKTIAAVILYQVPYSGFDKTAY